MPNSLKLDQLLPPVVHIAEMAGALLLSYYKKALTINRKTDGSEVTNADHASDELIRQQLQRLTPQIPIITEETYGLAEHQADTDGYFWCVDPLDGTAEFISRNRNFGVNIALIHKDTPVLGVIHCPALQETYGSHEGGPALQFIEGHPTPIQTRTPPPGEVHGVINWYHYRRQDEASAILRHFGLTDLQARNGPIRFCLVAKGEADVSFMLHNCSEWDTAAGHIILRSAGGEIYDLHGTPLTYGKKDIRQPPSISTGIPNKIRPLIEKINPKN